jgi:chloride channel protein, CIC family
VEPVNSGLATQPRPSRVSGFRAGSNAVGRWITGGSYVRKWIVLGVVIGVIAGSGAVVFYAALEAATHFFLGILAGYRVPTPFGEGDVAGETTATREWALPMIVGGGALLGAILVFWIAPEAEGHGTDAAISAVHHNPRGVRFRTVVVKIVASALTIGSGGSGGREGPTGQISAGFGSVLARGLDLEPADARVAVATGIGAGIGSIFGAPLGGAVLAAEILYRDDFDPAALLPSFIASGVGYLIFGAVEGYTPLFGYEDHYHFGDPTQLLWFALLGILGGLVGLLYAKGFYGLHHLFSRSPLPKWANPALAGVAVGASAIAIPEVLGTGYGWIQQGLGPQLSAMPLWIVLALPFARIVATGLSIGSGGSGGIFGPGMVIGAFVGAAVWRLFEPLFPSSLGHDPAPYVIVGMMCCFGSVARAPLAVMLMVAEMTGTFTIVEPGMVAVGLAWLIVDHTNETMYRSQLASRADSPSRRILEGLPLLATLTVKDARAAPKVTFPDDTTVGDARRALTQADVAGAPVTDSHGRFEGVISTGALDSADPDGPIRPLVDAAAPVAAAGAHLDVVLDALPTHGAGFVTAVDKDRRILGILAVPDLLHAYQRALETRQSKINGLSGHGTFEIIASKNSSFAGRRLRDAPLPAGVIVTAIHRDGNVLLPHGDTTIEEGDRLSLIGRAPTRAVGG